MKFPLPSLARRAALAANPLKLGETTYLWLDKQWKVAKSRTVELTNHARQTLGLDFPDAARGVNHQVIKARSSSERDFDQKKGEFEPRMKHGSNTDTNRDRQKIVLGEERRRLGCVMVKTFIRAASVFHLWLNFF